MHASKSFSSGLNFCDKLSSVPVNVVFTAIPPVSETSFSFRLALFVLLFFDGGPARVEPALKTEEFDDKESFNEVLVAVAIANTSKIEDHIFGIGVNFNNRFDGDSNESSFLSDFSIPQEVVTPSLFPPCQRIDLVLRSDNKVTRSIAA